ncbi:MAG: hypothetical protein IT337_07250, partial [Thermomicrobiales bacterium]|nr:hypothetical protein [Thermomicrobiales bacterium]
MDPSRFDGLVRSLAQRSTRRGILGISIGGAAGLLTAAAPGSAKHHHHGGDRPCKNNGKTCRKGRHCCSGKC